MVPSFGLLCSFLRQNVDRYLHGIPERNDEPYATHVPVLVALGLFYPIHRILEFGSGTYSTLTFLNRNAFPHVNLVTSLENDAEWGSKVRGLANGDPRLQLSTVDSSICVAAKELSVDDYDLILIDDSTSAAERTETIRTVAELKPAKSLIVIHDYECKPYRQAARGFSKVVRITALNPNVGILCNDAQNIMPHLYRFNNVIRQFRDSIPLSDIDGWSEAFQRIKSAKLPRQMRV